MTTKTFIDRPLLSAVISIFIIALGVIALLTLPVERYPDINVQNRVIQAQAQLPQEVLQLGISTEKQQPGQLRIIALESPGATFDERKPVVRQNFRHRKQYLYANRTYNVGGTTF